MIHNIPVTEIADCGEHFKIAARLIRGKKELPVNIRFEKDEATALLEHGDTIRIDVNWEDGSHKDEATLLRGTQKIGTAKFSWA